MRIALYARVSTASEDQEGALQQQLDRLRAAAAGHETTEFIDIASGSKDDRQQLALLLKACHSGKIDRVICTRLDRISRSTAHGAKLLSYFSADDTPSLCALDDNLDLATVGGRMMAGILICLAQAETERLSERVRHGKAYQRKHLMPLGPNAPYGYRFTRGRTNYELDPTTAEAARRVVEEFIRTRQLRPTLRFAQKLPGCPWISETGIRSWLMNPTLAGYRVYGQDETYRDNTGRLRKRRRRVGDYAEIYPDAHPPLISAVQHAQVRAILLEHRNRERSGVLTGYVRELTKLVTCSHCGRCMVYQQHVRLGPIYLRCPHFTCGARPKNRIKVQVVKDAIWQKLRRHREELLAYAVACQGNNAEQLQEAQKLHEQIRDYQQKQDPDLEEVIARKQERLADLLQMQGHRLDVDLTSKQMRKALESEGYWQLLQADPETTRRMFTDHVQQVLVRNKQVEAVILRLPSARLTSSDT